MNVSRLLISAFCLLAGARVLSALQAGPLDIHGSLSVMGATSDRYYFYGETGGEFGVPVWEGILNAQHRWENGLRVAVQGYAFQIEEREDLALDFALLEYPLHPALGLRAGRVKWPLGLHNEYQDVDMVTPFALLPRRYIPRPCDRSPRRSMAARFTATSGWAGGVRSTTN